MTTCTNCNHQNDGGKFCENCGSPLVAAATPSVEGTSIPKVVGQPQGSTEPNQYLEGAKQVSKQYGLYFLQVLKKPYSSSVNVGAEHFTNGLITMFLYSILIPLIVYFALKGVLADVSGLGTDFFGEEVEMDIPFMEVVITPAIAYVAFVLLVATFSFAAIKLGRINVGFKEVVARFGVFLIPAVAILAIGLLFAILKVKMFVFFTLLGFLILIFLVPPLVIASFKKDSQEGIDVIYGSLITYVLSFVALAIMGDLLFEQIKSYVLDMIGGGLY
jgi:hypothetical protein